jgi:hypothetical protein
MKNQGKGLETAGPCRNEYVKSMRDKHWHLQCWKNKFVDMRHRMKGDNGTHIDGSFRDWQKAKSKGFNSVQKGSEVSLKTTQLHRKSS